jgi:anthranilate synthase/aminodeoxychorismate synthase-like glutamine amidotransferase
MRLLMIDNYDSFTYNLVQYLGELGAEVEVFRNDVAAPEELLARNPAGVVISPGPGEPADAGISVEMVRQCAERGVPLLGVCLGHQSIGVAFGGRIARARSIMHGKTSEISHAGRGVFEGVENPFVATRYHSLVVDRGSLPDVLEVTAQTPDGEIMGLRHRETPIEGVQFHPESILTRVGKSLLAGFLAGCGHRPAA